MLGKGGRQGGGKGLGFVGLGFMGFRALPGLDRKLAAIDQKETPARPPAYHSTGISRVQVLRPV